jgi:ubiquinone/menaquinone biosynthesis C-methylase UbiE
MKLATVFDNAQLYKLFQFGVIKAGTSEIIRNEVLMPVGVENVLDFGCGIGYHSVEFPNSQYLGIEPLESCVNKADRLFRSSNASFVLGDHQKLKDIPDSSYDLIIAIGVLHHIDDSTFHSFIEEGYRILKPNGRITTFDPVIHPTQTKISKWVVLRDRGNFVRTEKEYRAIIEEKFAGETESQIYTNLLRIPYDHIRFHCIKRVT